MNWFRNLRTQSKFLIIVMSVAFFSMMTTGYLIYSIVRLNVRISDNFKTVEWLSDLKLNKMIFMEAEKAVRDYLLTADDYYFSLYEDCYEQVNENLILLLQETRVVEERSNLTYLQEIISDYKLAVEEVVADFENGSFEDQAQVVDSIEYLDVFAFDVHDQFDNIVNTTEFYQQYYVQQSEQRMQRVVLLGVWGMAMVIVIIIIGAIGFNQATEPLNYVLNAVVAFENNAYKPELLEKYLRARDEGGRLASSFARMAHTITESTRVKDQYLKATRRFVPVEFMEFLEKDSIADINLGDHVSAEMAIMFSDIRGFTTFSESMTPQENFDFVNDYLQRVSPMIKKNGGFIVKYLGDGMMAIFPYGADDAVMAAIEKCRQIEQFNDYLRERNMPIINVGIGIHTGHMMVGMVGETKRIQGDAFSDNVNLTSRVEGLTKYFGVSVVITEEAIMRLESRDRYHLRFLGRVRVKGKQKPLSLYEIYDGDTTELRILKDETKEDFELGLKEYISGDFLQSLEHFRHVVYRNADDRVANLYMGRCERLLTEGVGEDWEGIEVMVDK